ncbi:MAG TPA: dockerin type I domain-containing protein, partial [Phycisphaerae bacterium]|nr:dockerin type I domain-containing protein [Phycisphaerae bacterium]
TGVPITGTSAGSTNYTASCEDQLVVSLWAPKLVVVQNARYKLLRWTLDGADQPPGQASLQLVMDAPHTAVAVYEQVAPSLILRGPADRGEPPLPPAGSTFTVDVYLNNLYDFAGMQAALDFIDPSGADAGFLISTAGGNSTFDGMKIDFNSSLWPVIFAVTAGDLRTFGFMSMAGDLDITQETWVFTVTYEYGPSAPGGYSIVTDPLLTAVGGGSGGINFQESAGSLVIQQQALRGDIDGNCVVDLADLIAVRDRLLVDPGSPGYLDADLNGDGRVNVLDLILVRNLMGRKCEENDE